MTSVLITKDSCHDTVINNNNIPEYNTTYQGKLEKKLSEYNKDIWFSAYHTCKSLIWNEY